MNKKKRENTFLYCFVEDLPIIRISRSWKIIKTTVMLSGCIYFIIWNNGWFVLNNCSFLSLSDQIKAPILLCKND